MFNPSMTSPSQAIPPETFIGDLQSYDDCGIVNGITADSFIVPWVCFFFGVFRWEKPGIYHWKMVIYHGKMVIYHRKLVI